MRGAVVGLKAGDGFVHRVFSTEWLFGALSIMYILHEHEAYLLLMMECWLCHRCILCIIIYLIRGIKIGLGLCYISQSLLL